MDTRAVVWSGPKQAEYRTVSLGEPKPGEVLIESVYSLVSPGTEREWLTSDESHAVLGTTFPFVPGYSVAGRIAALGEGVTGLAIGDRVVAGPPVGGHAAHVIAPAAAVFSVPDDVPLRSAVFFNLGATAAHTVRLSGVRLGDSLSIVGQGPIGLLATQIAAAQGAWPILALDLDPDRRAAALAKGASYAADPTDAAFAETLAQVGGGTRATIDLSGVSAGINTALQVTAPLGTAVFSSGMTAPVTLDYGSLFVKGLTVIGALVAVRPAEMRQDTENFLRLVATGAVTTPDRDEDVHDPTTAAQVYQRVLAGDRTLTAPLFAWHQDDH
ncbi:zinc-dependent alcohol dehydrogenase [Streptomyces griseorubiginosus]|uniref:zinc-dependent alcohol dehydrogenase n=1 Tax=Streptomyces griseorubiginosus TaxID=67304 RepID=UPI001AD74D12|nr:zinc-binding alcohol dehydrogenase [Streptomyces griseorubiginosus]MBO4256369.1 zinc-binding dehydrogenase [Streptomyces griseorubiginosus]